MILRLCRVKGHSMSPSYQEGDYVLSITTKGTRLNVGDPIIFKNSLHGLLLKRISQKRENGYLVSGSHPLSTDSRSLGLVTPEMVVGKVVLKLPLQRKKILL